MKKTRVIAFTLALLFVFSVIAGAKSVKPLSGETSHKEKTLYTGVVHAEITTDSSTPTYNQQHFNVLTVDMSKRDLYLETAYMNDSVRVTYGTPGSTVQGTVAQYNQKHSDKRVIAAINGDMWLIASQTKGYVKTSEFTVSRAFNIVNGEIYTTGVIQQEPSFAGIPWAFGITDDFVPNLGQPYTKIKMTDVTKDIQTGVDGINRVPADNAIIMYTDRLMGSYNNFALDDAYEMLIEFDEDYTMCHGANVTGTLKAIYSSDSSEDAPKINNKQMVITARGSKIASVNNFAIGDKINITVEIHDATGRDDIWQRVTQSIGGNIAFIKDGVRTGADLGQTTYPTTLIGYDRDGKIIMLTMDGRGKGGSGASTLRLNQLITDLDLYDAVILDGGGSMTMVTATDKTYESYKTVSTSSDGSDRKVNNAFILAYGPERCEQGNIDINITQSIEDPTNVTFPTEAHARSFVTGPNEAAISWEDECLKLSVKNLQIGDPFVSFSYLSASSLPSADKYKYLALVYKMPKTNSQARYGTELFCQCEYRGAEVGQSVNVATKCTDQFEYVLYNPGALTKWKGSITGLRIDFMSVPMGEGDYMLIHNIILAETKEEARLTAKRIKDDLNAAAETEAVTEPETTEEPVTEPETEPETDIETDIETEPEETEPEETEPEETEPEETEPEETEPEETEPEETEPEETEPEETEPEETEPEETEPEETEPEETEPEETEPEETEPEETEPEETEPEETEPEETKPEETEPEETEPEETEPEQPEAIPGDINGDGEVNNKDVVVLFRYVSGTEKDADESIYDFNGDGEVNNKDVVALFRKVSEATA